MIDFIHFTLHYNETYEEDKFKFLSDENVKHAHMIFVIVSILYIPMIIASNIIVFWGILLYPGFYTSNNFLLMNLAVYDGMVGLVCLPMYVLCYSDLTKEFISDNKYLCLIRFCSVIMFAGGSIHALLFLSIDRYIAVMWPLRYCSLVTNERMIRLLVVLGVYMFTISMLPIMGWNFYDYKVKNLNERCHAYRVLPKIYIIWSTVIALQMCIWVSVILNVQIIYVVLQQIKASKKTLPTWSNDTIVQFENRINSVKVTVVLMILFIILWLPFILVAPLKIKKVFSPETTEVIKTYAMLMFFANSAVNAAIYAILREEYREVYTVMLTSWPWNWKNSLRKLHRELNYKYSIVRFRRTYDVESSVLTSEMCLSDINKMFSMVGSQYTSSDDATKDVGV